MEQHARRFISLTLSDELGISEDFKGYLSKEKSFSTFGRLVLLGVAPDAARLKRLASIGLTFLDRPVGGDRPHASTISGEVSLIRSTMGWHAPGIGDDTVHEIAEFAVHCITELSLFERGKPPTCFLRVWPPSASWPIPMLVVSWDGTIKNWTGRPARWVRPRGTTVEFRLVAAFSHSGRNGSNSEERSWEPSIEMRAKRGVSPSPEEFSTECERLWRALKVLLSFYAYSPHDLLERQQIGFGTLLVRRWPRDTTPVQLGTKEFWRLRGISIEAFCARAAGVILAKSHDVDALHAAVYRNNGSLSQGTFEAQVTSAFEAIETLLQVIDAHFGLTRDGLTKQDYKTYKSKSKEFVNALPFLAKGTKQTGVLRSRISKWLAINPPLNLEERITRALKMTGATFLPHERLLGQDLSTLISLRNRIVHGGPPGDYEAGLRELYRARLLFEKLLLSLLGYQREPLSGEEVQFVLEGALQKSTTHTSF